MASASSPGNIKTPPIGSGTPKYDWRELQRWNISESRLPPGSEVHFRVPSVWEQYRTQIAAGVATLLLQAAIISWLLVERRRRYSAQAEPTSRRREVIRLNRVATASVLSLSIAHELNQPLGAILSNTEAAQVLLDASQPDADRMGYTARIEAAGGNVLSGMCFYQSYAREISEAKGWKRLATNSAKLVNILGGYGYRPMLASMESCVDAAVNGKLART
jgi:signal transduction histidine kinase